MVDAGIWKLSVCSAPLSEWYQYMLVTEENCTLALALAT
jgi:hypothetical protein